MTIQIITSDVTSINNLITHLKSNMASVVFQWILMIIFLEMLKLIHQPKKPTFCNKYHKASTQMSYLQTQKHVLKTCENRDVNHKILEEHFIPLRTIPMILICTKTSNFWCRCKDKTCSKKIPSLLIEFGRKPAHHVNCVKMKRKQRSMQF